MISSKPVVRAVVGGLRSHVVPPSLSVGRRRPTKAGSIQLLKNIKLWRVSASAPETDLDLAQVAKHEQEPTESNYCRILDRAAPALLAFATRVLSAAVVGLCLHALFPTTATAAAAAAAASSSGGSGGNAFSTIISFVLHLDHHMSGIIERHGNTTYAILFAIVFCETGLVLTPFLPGDSLLFAAGAFAGMGKLQIGTLMAVFLVSAILGDAVNYAIGKSLGRWALDRKIVKQEYVDKTEKFYSKYGGKTVVLARFVPIIRTFAPFVAGVGSMPYAAFAMYNVLGAVIWAVLFVGAGFFFGNLPFVQKNFTLVVLGIVAVSVVPVIIEIMNARREAAGGGHAQ